MTKKKTSSLRVTFERLCVFLLLTVTENKSYDMRVQEDKHKEEVAALKKKLHWFAENQDLLDRDASRLKAATAETQQLKEQVF